METNSGKLFITFIRPPFRGTMTMYFLWILYAIFLGLIIRTCTPEETRQMGKGAKILMQGSSPNLYLRGVRIPLTPLAGSLLFFLIIAVLNDLTYALWMGSVLGFLSLLFPILLASVFLEASFHHLEGHIVPRNQRVNWAASPGGRWSILLRWGSHPHFIRGIPVLGLILLVTALVSGSLVPAIILVLGLPVMICFAFLATSMEGSAHTRDATGTLREILGLGSDTLPLSRILKAMLAIFSISLLILANLTPYTGDLESNPTFRQLNETGSNTGDADTFLTGHNDVRVISWDLATQYLQRAYGDAASTLSTDPAVLALNTDPDYVNGKFVWVNAPQYEFIKWTGGKTVPFFVHVVNDPQNMSRDGFDAVTRSDEPFEVHRERISWQKRIDQVLHDRYAGTMVNIQIRITLDDDYHPYWVVYLGRRHILRDVVDLKRILIIDAMDMDRTWEYGIQDPAIPDWLEVVYPDTYLMDWARLWGSWREGILYRWFNKRHLSFPDDTPRFLILNGTSYWYLPMRQLNSQVLAGYILMNTRTGETTYHNREARSLADRYTAQTQVARYLRSGAQGFRQLEIQEGYLYPIRTDSGTVREAYIFPLYSGFTIQQYAMVDAQYFTQNPFFGNDLQSLLRNYRSHAFGGTDNGTLEWSDFTLESAYAEEEEGAFIANGTTFVVRKDALAGGMIVDPENEWREFRLAVSDLQRGMEVTISAVVVSGTVLDVDYPRSDLVRRES